MPVLLSSLVDVPAGELAGAVAADDDSRCCLRQWLAGVPDSRSPLGRWHLLKFGLALAICAFTAAGHDSPAAIAEWAGGCSQDTLAAVGGRRDPWTRRVRPPSTRTFSRVFGHIDAEAFNAAVYGYVAAMPAGSADALPAVSRHEREQRRAAAHLAPAIAHQDLIRAVVTLDARHTQAETTRHLVEDKKAHYLIAYGITSLPASVADPRHLAAYARSHWAIENREHCVRDKTVSEDLQQVRTGNQPNAYVAIRNLVTGAFRRTGYANVAHARRYYGRDDQRILALYGYIRNGHQGHPVTHDKRPGAVRAD